MKMKKILIAILAAVMCFSVVSCGNKKTVESYIASIQDEIDSMTDMYKNSGFDLSVTAKDNTMVYTFKYNIDIGADADTVKATLESGMAAQESTFTTILSTLKKEIPSAESILVEYLDKDGNTLYSKEFK